MKCPNCQTENPEGAKFCRECAQILQTELVCPQCGHTNTLGSKFCSECAHPLAETLPPSTPPSPEPTSFVSGRYQVKRFLSEGGQKKVYLVHDTVLDRDVAFALLKTEQLDEEAKTRIKREAQAMGRLGDHPNIITIFEFGEHEGQPYLVFPLMPGGDVDELIDEAPEHRLPLEQVIDIAKSVCQRQSLKKWRKR